MSLLRLTMTLQIFPIDFPRNVAKSRRDFRNLKPTRLQNFLISIVPMFDNCCTSYIRLVITQAIKPYAECWAAFYAIQSCVKSIEIHYANSNNYVERLITSMTDN